MSCPIENRASVPGKQWRRNGLFERYADASVSATLLTEHRGFGPGRPRRFPPVATQGDAQAITIVTFMA
jgi:hypothetical protein